MLNFVKGAFRGLVETLLWIIPIVGAVVGGRMPNDGLTFWGVIVGLIVGFFVDIVLGGLTATLIAIDENTAKTEANTAKMLKVLLKRANTTANSVADEWGADKLPHNS